MDGCWVGLFCIDFRADSSYLIDVQPTGVDKGLTFSPNSLIDKYCMFEVMDSGWSEDDPENIRVLGKAVWSKNSEKS